MPPDYLAAQCVLGKGFSDVQLAFCWREASDLRVCAPGEWCVVSVATSSLHAERGLGSQGCVSPSPLTTPSQGLGSHCRWKCCPQDAGWKVSLLSQEVFGSFCLSLLFSSFSAMPTGGRAFLTVSLLGPAVSAAPGGSPPTSHPAERPLCLAPSAVS